MVKILRTQDNRWGIYAPQIGVVMEPGKFEDMVDQAQALGVRSEQLDHAFSDMFQRNTNCAEFGMSLRGEGFGFIFSETVAILERRTGSQAILALDDAAFEKAVVLGGVA